MKPEILGRSRFWGTAKVKTTGAALCVLCALVLVCSIGGQVGSAPPYLAVLSASNPGFLLVGFNNPPGAGAGGTMGIYTSHDASVFSPTNPLPSYSCEPTVSVRDPSVIRYAGNYLVAHTDACTAATSLGFFSYAHSTDAISWVTPEDFTCPLSGSCWAPEWFADPAVLTYDHTNGWTGGVSGLHLYFANSTNSTCCSAFTLYETHPTNTNFVTTPASWSTPVALTFTSGSPVPIDPFMVCKNSVTGADCQNPAVANDGRHHPGNDGQLLWLRQLRRGTRRAARHRGLARNVESLRRQLPEQLQSRAVKLRFDRQLVDLERDPDLHLDPDPGQARNRHSLSVSCAGGSFSKNLAQRSRCST